MKAMNIKKIIIAMAVVLTLVDITLLFAANSDTVDPQLVAQVAAMTGQSSSASTNPANIDQDSSAQAVVPVVAADQISQIQQQGLSAVSNVTPTSLHQQAFKETMEQSLPLTPAQIVQMHQLMDASQKAAATSPVVPPKPVSTSLSVGLSPGVTPPVLNLQQGLVTSVVFTDSQGQPFPIESYDVGNATDFDVQWDKKSNLLLVQPSKNYQYGNLVVRLKDLDTPVSVMLTSGNSQVFDSRVDLHIQAMDAASQSQVVSTGLPQAASSKLLSVLDAVGPGDGASSVQVKGCPNGCLAWSIPGAKDSQGNQAPGELFLRLPGDTTLLSPGFKSKSSSADGTSAYLITEQSPTLSLIVSRAGAEDSYSVTGLQ